MVLSDFLQYGAHFRTFSPKSNEGNLKYIRKGPFELFWTLFTQFGPNGIFLKNLAPSFFSLYGPLTSCKKPDKTDEPILSKMRYERMDEQGWIHRTFPDKGRGPIKKKQHSSLYIHRRNNWPTIIQGHFTDRGS